MYYQLFHYSDERVKKFPMNKPMVLVYSLSEKTLNTAVKRLKKVDPKIKELTCISEKKPKISEENCILVAGSQEDAEQYYKC